MTEGHGDDLYKYAGLVKVNFSSNIYTHPDLSRLERHLSERLNLVCNYPEPEPLSLERLLATESNVSTDEVMVTNGATEAIYLIALNYSKLNGNNNLSHVIKQPTFSEYADACRLYRNNLSDEKSLDGSKKVHWLCNPNNPTGSVLPSTEILAAADRNPNSVFVIDQSYENYTSERMISDREAVERQNVLLLHSMTKRFCVPGLRIGYVVTNKQIISDLKRLRHPWSVNALAIAAGSFLIENGIDVLPDISVIEKEAQRLCKMLKSIDGISVNATRTNFMLARLKYGKAADLKDFLIRKYGFLIRDASNFMGLDGSYFRIAAQEREENDALVEAIKTFVKEEK